MCENYSLSNSKIIYFLYTIAIPMCVQYYE